jgi:hypothetical protein
MADRHKKRGRRHKRKPLLQVVLYFPDQCRRFRFLLFAFKLLLVDRTPLVLAFPLSLVRTAVFDETVLLFVLAGIGVLSTTPWRGGLPVLAFALLLLVLSVVPHPAKAVAPVITNARVMLSRIFFDPPVCMA